MPYEISSHASSTSLSTAPYSKLLYYSKEPSKNQGSLLLFGKLHHIADLGHNFIIVLPSVGDQTVGAVLDAILRIGKIAAAFVAQGIQRAVAEQAAEGIFIFYLVARKIFAFFVLKKVVVGHIITSDYVLEIATPVCALVRNDTVD